MQDPVNQSCLLNLWSGKFEIVAAEAGDVRQDSVAKWAGY